VILLDSREGSWQLSRFEPLRSLLPVCPACQGLPADCLACRQWDKSIEYKGSKGAYVSVGRQLSRITTSQGEGGPDALICGNGPSGPLLVAAEVKSVSDLLSSAATGRLQSATEGQVPAMLADYDQNWLIWYGTVRYGAGGGLETPAGRNANGGCIWGPYTHDGRRDGRPVRNEFFRRMLIAVAAMGVHVHRVHDAREAAVWLAELHGYWTKGYDEHGFTRVFNAAPRFPQTVTGYTRDELMRARRVFDRYSGLGMERSLAVAKHFGSVREMANADEKEWQKVPGIGKGIAAAMVREFNS
jgi:ERCC4-type nuclease